MSKLIRIAFALVATAALLFPATASAQVLYGTITGTVTDQSGAVVPNAQVSITNKETGLTRETTTDEGGRYNIVNVAPGRYDLKVSATGFRPFSQTDLDVSINQIARTDIRLEVGAVAETVTVQGAATLLQTDKSDVRAELGTVAVTNLPLNTYRNYQALMTLAPGTMPVEFQNAVVDTPGRSLRTQVNGQAPNNNNTRVDGAANVFLWLPHHTLYNPPVEAIQEVNVTTASFDAEQGMAGGAAVTVMTKSGTNDFHGVGFWYHDNQHLKSRPYFFRQPKMPIGINNIAGGTLGGPIVKNRLFFFGSYERTMQRGGNTSNLSVPPEDMRRGDFSRYASAGPGWIVYDPLTGNPDGTGRTPFQNNIIPSGRISPIWQRIQSMAPLPNQPGSGLFNLDENFGFGNTVKLDRDQYDLKVNWNATSNMMVWGKYSRMDGVVFGAPPFGELVGPTVGTQGTGDTNVNIPTFGYTYTFSPTFVTDGVFGYTRFDQQVFGVDFGKNWGTETFGIPGTNGGTQFANDDRYSGMPAITGFGFSDWGNLNTWQPLFRNDRSWLYTTNFSKIKGSHEIRFGFDMIRHAMNHWQPETANPRGEIAHSGFTTALRGGASPQRVNSYAAALMGLPQTYSKSVQFFDMKTREWQLGWYVRDRWQATRNLTVNLGLRYEYYPLMDRGDRGLERWDPATNLVYLGGLGNVPRDVGIEVSKKLFAPRLGFAYRLGDKTVIRAGYGLTIDPLPFGRPLRGIYPATITGRFTTGEQYAFNSNRLAQGIPAIPLPDVSSGIVTLPATVDMGPRSPWGGMLNRGYIQTWNLFLERRLPGDVSFAAGYVGNHTVHWLLDRDINAGPPGLGNAGRPLAATQGRLIGANMWDGWGDAKYHALQTTWNRQFRGGLYLKGQYTFSKAMNLTDEDGWASPRFTNWLPAIHRNYTVAGYDRTHAFSTGWVYELPFGSGRKWNMSGPANAVFGGWQVNGVFYAYSGTPFNVTASTASLNAAGTSFQTADLVGEVRKIGDKGPNSQYYDVTAFRDPNFQRPSNVFRFGTMGPNTLRGPGFWRIDGSIFKTFKLTERVGLEFKTEAFNLTNTPRFNNPGGNVSAMTVDASGRPTATNNFMAITSARDERQVRFGLRLSF